MAELKNIKVQDARPLPVIILADVSGSMKADGKIQALNGALDEMIKSFHAEEDLRAEIQVAVITFGAAGAALHQALIPARDLKWAPMAADGNTPLGAAFDRARELVEDRAKIPGRAYRPTLVLVSDGQPTDAWKEPLERLLASERASKGQRFALAIGADADVAVLSAFAGHPERVFRADEARKIREFFDFVTMSVVTRSRAPNPNDVTPPTNLDEAI